MASIARTVLLRSRQHSRRIQYRSSCKRTTQWHRPFSISSIRFENEDSKDIPVTEDIPQSSETTDSSPQDPISASMLDDLNEDLRNLDEKVIAEKMQNGERGLGFGKDAGLESDEDFEIKPDDVWKVMEGFWAEGEPEMGPDEDYYGDDLTAAGHGELQKHRDLREYARLIAWELPLLSQLAKPFEPPPAETPFRFRYTSYFGEKHPAVNKVVVEFCPSDLSLSEAEIAKLIKLVGPRYNPDSTIIKLSCEKFDTQAQNKRYLGETIEVLIAEAKNPKDMFDDMPFDFRYHKSKVRHEFPKEWVMTKERKKYLEEKRKKTAQIEDERLQAGKLLDGKTIIENSLPFTQSTEPVMVNASRTKS